MRVVFFIMVTISLFAGDINNSKVNKEDMIDYLALSALLYKDGNYARAKVTIQDVNLSSVDKSYYFTLNGLIDLKLFDYKSSVKNFNRAIEEGAKDRTLYIYLAKAYYKLGILIVV